MTLVPAGGDRVGWERGVEHGLQSQTEMGPNPGSTFYSCETLGKSLSSPKNLPHLENRGDNTSIFSLLGLTLLICKLEMVFFHSATLLCQSVHL